MSHDILKTFVIVSGNNFIWSEKEREEIIDHALEIYLSKPRITSADSDDGHEIDDEDDEDDLDSEDERLVDELMVFNVDDDTSDIGDTHE